VTEKTEKFAERMDNLKAFLRAEARNNNRNYETLLIGAMNGILAYHGLINDKPSAHTNDIRQFIKMLDQEQINEKESNE